MTYHIYAGPASPYSHKVRAVFRYRRIPHTWLVPVVEYPDGSYKADSIPIPPHPAIAFLAYFIEDMCDEYLPFPMFYFRWVEDDQWCGRRQMTGWNGALDDQTLDEYATNFLNRQQSQLGALKAMPRATVLENYHRFLDAMKERVKGTDISKALNGPGCRVKCLLQVKQAFADLSDEHLALQFAEEEAAQTQPLQVG